MNTTAACHVFIQWLAHEDILDQWLNAILITYGDDYIQSPLDNFLVELQDLSSDSNSFTYEWLIVAMPSWDTLPEGEAFWSTLDEEWQLIAEEIKNGDINDKQSSS